MKSLASVIRQDRRPSGAQALATKVAAHPGERGCACARPAKLGTWRP